jgi:tetratricopeptide (TPR) repeat protein
LADHLLSIGEGARATATSDAETIRALESLGYVSAPPAASEEPSKRRDPKDCITDYDRYQAAHMESALNRPDKALTIMEELEPAFQNSAFFYSRWGSFAAQAGRWERAASCYEKCLALDAGRQETRLNLGVAYLKSDAPAKALEQLEALLRINPNHAEAHLYAGVVNNDHIGERAKAIEHWRRFLEIAPNHKQAQSVRELLDAKGDQ